MQNQAQRKIIHIDMDCFFAAVEVMDQPDLKGLPVIVGGLPDRRGVVCTCSYEARAFGVRSAMASSRAYQLCPGAIFIRPKMNRYREISGIIHKIFHQFTDRVESVSLDEAYLDVSHHNLFATEIAQKIRETIYARLGLTCSAGVAPNKMVAKIASDIRKPDGLTVIKPKELRSFMGSLSLRKIPGVGPATETVLNAQGLQTCSDLWKFSELQLSNLIGKSLGERLYGRSRGIDHSVVKSNRERKSIGSEETYQKDIQSQDVIYKEFLRLSERVSKLLNEKSLQGHTFHIKVKSSDFKQVTRSITLDMGFADQETLFELSKQLWQKTGPGLMPVRLLGLSVSNLERSVQLTRLF